MDTKRNSGDQAIRYAALIAMLIGMLVLRQFTDNDWVSVGLPGGLFFAVCFLFPGGHRLSPTDSTAREPGHPSPAPPAD